MVGGRDGAGDTTWEKKGEEEEAEKVKTCLLPLLRVIGAGGSGHVGGWVFGWVDDVCMYDNLFSLGMTRTGRTGKEVRMRIHGMSALPCQQATSGCFFEYAGNSKVARQLCFPKHSSLRYVLFTFMWCVSVG